MVRAPPRVLPRSLAPSGVLGGGRSGPGSPLLGLGLWGWRQGVPGGGAFYRCVGRLGSCAPPPPTARPLGGLSGSVIHVLWARACGCGGPALSLRPARPVGAARRGAGPWRSYVGGRAGGGGVRRTPRLHGWGGACGAGGRSASFRPSALPGQATKRASLALCCPWGAWPPIPLRFVLTRLLWVRSVRRPGAQARARLFFVAPVGAGGWGGGAGRTPAPLSGGGGPSPLPRGVRAGAPAAFGLVGGRGGGGCRAAASLLSFWAAACGTPSWPPSCRRRALFRRARAVGAEVPPRAGGGEGRPVADLKPPLSSLSGLWLREGHVWRGLLPVQLCALLQHAGVGSREQVQPPLPPPRRRPFWGGGRPPGPGGAEGRACGSPAEVGAGGGGWGAAPTPALGPMWEGGGGVGGALWSPGNAS